MVMRNYIDGDFFPFGDRTDTGDVDWDYIKETLDISNIQLECLKYMLGELCCSFDYSVSDIDKKPYIELRVSWLGFDGDNIYHVSGTPIHDMLDETLSRRMIIGIPEEIEALESIKNLIDRLIADRQCSTKVQGND